MESGDHSRTEKFVSGSADHSKIQQYAELGMMENLHKSEQLGLMGDKQFDHQPEDFLFRGAVKNDMHVPSGSDSNEFIIHESRSNVSTEGSLLPARTNNEPTEAGINEGLSVIQKTHEDLGPIGGNQTSREILVPSDGQIIEANTERVSESTSGLTLTESDNENIISQDSLNEPIPNDSANTNSQITTVVTKERTQVNKTDVEERKSNEKSLTLTENIEFISDGQVSTDSTVDKSEPATLSEVKSEMEYVKGSSDDSNSFICNERSEVQRKTENDEISEAENHKQFLSHEGGEHSDREKQQTDLEDKHPTCIPSEKGDFVEDKNKTESAGRNGETNIGQNQEDLKLSPAGKQDKSENTNYKTSELPVSKHETEDEWLDILGTGHLKKKVIKKAENEYRPQSLQICEINLEGCLEDGTVVEKFENLKIQIGDVEVVQGIDLALPLMNVGEVALLEVGPRFAYGTIGRSPDIPPDAKLIYTIELLSAEDEPDLDSLSIARRKELGDRKRERGNWWFSRQEYSFAIQSYRRAIEFLDDAEGGFSIEKKDISEDAEKQLQELLEDRLKVFNNLAAAQMKIKAYDAALTSVDNVLRCQPQNVKALFRKGKILAAKGDTTTALSVLRNASQLEPESKVIKQEVQRLLDVIKRDTKQEKSLYKKMLGQNKSAEKTSSRGSRISYRTWGIACSSVAVVLLGAIAYRYKFL